jgi:hypothetical protein
MEELLLIADYGLRIAELKQGKGIGQGRRWPPFGAMNVAFAL